MGIFRDIRNRDWTRVKSFLKLYFYILLIVFVIALLIYHVIEIQILREMSYESNIMFTILNALVLGVFCNVLGLFNKGLKKKSLKFIVILIVILVFITGFGYLNFEFTINLPIFDPAHNVISTSSAKGVYFVLYNLWFFLTLIVLSFIIESERE